MSPQAADFFTTQRQRFFPPAINFLAAHITLFHHLPGSHLTNIQSDLLMIAASHEPLTLAVSGLRSLGRGVAYTVASEPLQKMRAHLASQWVGWLNAQDQAKFSPHITIQNKVSSAVAKETLATLQNEWRPQTFLCSGLDLWSYGGGPWSHLHSFVFAESKSQT